MERYKKQNNLGITLIALVVTIIILLILSTITITALSGDDGIIAKARKSKEEAEVEGIIEQIEIELYEEKVKTGKIPSKETLISIIEKPEDEDGFGTVNDNESFISYVGNYLIYFREIRGWSDYAYDDGGEEETPDVEIAGAQLEINADINVEQCIFDISGPIVFIVIGTITDEPYGEEEVIYDNAVMAEMNSSGKVTAVAKGIPQILKEIKFQVTCVYSAHTMPINTVEETTMIDGEVGEPVEFTFGEYPDLLDNVSSEVVTYVYREEKEDWETYQVLNNNKKGE